MVSLTDIPIQYFGLAGLSIELLITWKVLRIARNFENLDEFAARFVVALGKAAAGTLVEKLLGGLFTGAKQATGLTTKESETDGTS